MTAFETIKYIIKNHVDVMNLYRRTDDMTPATMDRFLNELKGMMICLKNIKHDDNFYTVNDWGDRYEFGYYNGNGKWIKIK